ncbi:small T antigen [Potamochoerus porcus polyomavirus 1]|uniref:Small T antigen n=1 Tax=Potamochoerus porcus polyomavirus 1 TaxID=2170410 RepID=A0A2S1CJM0_9POLY|nr:small T antigen [Potamochoerus porcus polyomavirus 1]AWD33731.1 small T antigen [Potamochoerus porcus polyomavirus 1]
MELSPEECEELQGLLGIADIGNKEELKKAFLKACKVHHPDKGKKGHSCSRRAGGRMHYLRDAYICRWG